MIRFLPFALLLAVSACVTTPTIADAGARATAAVARADDAYWRAKPFVMILLPALPLDRQVQVTAILDRVEYWLGLAKAAVTIADQLAALSEAESAMRTLTATLPAVPTSPPG